MLECYSEDELELLSKILKELPITENRLKKLLGILYSNVINKPFIIKTSPKTKKGVLKINFTTEFKKELKLFENQRTNVFQQTSNKPVLDKNLDEYLTNLINEQLKPVFQRLEKLENLVLHNSTLNRDSGANQMLKDEFTPKLKEIYDKININEHKGGMIPIPTIWKELGKENINFSVFTQYLYDLERNRVIDLQIVSDRRNIPNLELGIEDKVRGLLYYIVWRN